MVDFSKIIIIMSLKCRLNTIVPHFPYKMNRDVRSRVRHYPSYDVRGQASPSVIRPLTSPLFIIELSFSTHSGLVYLFKVMHCSVILFVNKHEQGKLIDVSQKISWTSLKNVRNALGSFLIEFPANV